MSDTDTLRAQLAVAELEEQLRSEKDEDGRGASSETKEKLRAARRAYRQARDTGTANPETVGVVADAKSPGGK